MSTLSEQALEFAKEHIEKFYDSDFFPKPLEYQAFFFYTFVEWLLFFGCFRV